MRIKLLSAYLIIIAVVLSSIQCGTEKKEVLLRLKFNPDQKLRWQYDRKEYLEIYENDSLVEAKDSQRKSEMIEEVVDIIDKNTARFRSIFYYDKKITDKNDSSKTQTVKDSSVMEYVQNDRAVTLEFQHNDTTSPEVIDYYKRLYEQMAPRYPDDPVSEGYSWNNSIKVMLKDGEVRDAVSTYRIKGFAREAGYDCVIMEFKGNTIVPYRGKPEIKEDRGDGIETRLDKQTTEGTCYFAYKEGFIVREERRFEFSAEGTRTSDKGEVKIRIASKGSFSYNLIKAEGLQ